MCLGPHRRSEKFFDSKRERERERPIYNQIVLPKYRSCIANTGTKVAVHLKGRFCTANAGTKVAVLLKGRSSTANSGTKVAVLLGMNRCGSFPFLSEPHSLFSIWTDLKRFEKIPGAPAWRLGEWICLTRLSGLHRNSPQGLNISSIRVFDRIKDPEIPITLRRL